MRNLETIKMEIEYYKDKLLHEYIDVMSQQLKDANLDGEVKNIITGEIGRLCVGGVFYSDLPMYQFRRYKKGTNTLTKYAQSNIKDIETVKKYFRTVEGE